jgi:ABC-2 type transport system permease protein
MQTGPNYFRVLLTFAQNSLVREMTFRGNFLITVLTRAFWFVAQLALFEIIYGKVQSINGWSKYEFFAFLATSMIVNTLIEAIFMPNIANFSELIRTGGLDFVLLKPIDAQFLISFERLDLGTLSHLILSGSLLGYSIARLDRPIDPVNVALYICWIGIAVAFFYSLMVALASTTIWFGRNQGLYDFWFYITIFARYPQNIYQGSMMADAFRLTFSYGVPVLLVVTIPARILLAKTLEPSWITLLTLGTTLLCLLLSRAIFERALRSYRSASS